ncbi:MBL fold metallo-hydrolase [Ruminococcaceae bacterium OttesenSCG-928-A16]|nr:MBL fold metallo-hydrolase [Ruminococcaceae bacterium OttesenSCG-928-A16]
MSRFTTLYSGSSGNAGVAEHEGRFLLIDMGGSCKMTVAGLQELGLSPQNLGGILVTHEHSDHIKGLNVFLKRFPVPVYGSVATLEALWQMEAVPETTELIGVDEREEDVEGFVVKGFATSHDSAGCCGFRITMPNGKVMAIATDLGEMNNTVFSNLHGAQLVALEANYDPEMLLRGPYPYYLKKRIDSPRGHLSNQDSAATVAALLAAGTQNIALCHLSKENNHPNYVHDAISHALLAAGIQQPQDTTIQISRRYEVSPWMEF